VAASVSAEEEVVLPETVVPPVDPRLELGLGVEMGAKLKLEPDGVEETPN
jgi:hypothetical protein